jgi:UDP-glucose 4-epimerase
MIDFQNCNVAVTGARGYIGSAVTSRLLGLGARVLCVSSSPQEVPDGAIAIEADLRTEDAWSEIVSKADVIFHLAGNTSVYAAAANPADSLESTLLPLTHLVKEAQHHRKVPRVIYASTATVYGMTPVEATSEVFHANPITVYDLHKKFTEEQLALATLQGHLLATSLRLANVYGPSSGKSSASDRGVLNKMMLNVLRGGDITLYGDGEYLRDYVHIDDVVNAFLLAASPRSHTGSVFNIATGNGLTLKHAAALIIRACAKVTGKTHLITYSPWPSATSDIERRNFVADITLAKSTLGWIPAIQAEDGIGMSIKKFSEIQ